MGTRRNGLRDSVTTTALSARSLTLGALTLVGFSPVIWAIGLGLLLNERGGAHVRVER